MVVAINISPSSVEAVGIVIPFCAFVTVAFRFHVRNIKSNPSRLDDWLILISLILHVAFGATMVVGLVSESVSGPRLNTESTIGAAIGGLGQPTPQGNGPDGILYANNRAMIILNKIHFVFNLSQPWTFGAIKLSVLFFYRRLFLGKNFDIISKVCIALVSIWTIGYFFAALFQCKTNFWVLWGTLHDYLSHCMKSTGLFESLAISDVILDVMILSIPVPQIWALQLSTKQKIEISGVFLLGSLSLVAGIVRMAILVESANGIHSFILQKASDNDFHQGFYTSAHIIEEVTSTMVWGLVEQGVAIIAACLPTLKPLVSKTLVESILRSIRGILVPRSSFSSRRSGQRDGNCILHDEQSASTAELAYLPAKNISQGNVSKVSSYQTNLQGNEPL